MVEAGIFYGQFYGHLVYLRIFGMFCGLIWCIYFPFWYAVPRKIWQPCRGLALAGRQHGDNVKQLLCNTPTKSFRILHQHRVTLHLRRVTRVFGHLIRVARWFLFEPKIPIWANFGGLWIGKY
jgi:hypothetical protein